MIAARMALVTSRASAVSLALLVGLLGVPTVYSVEAQVGGEAASEPKNYAVDSDILRRFDDAAGSLEAPIVAKLTWYMAPYARSYSGLAIRSDGRVFVMSAARDWAPASVRENPISVEAVEAFRAKMLRLVAGASSRPGRTVDGKRHVVLAVVEDGRVRRADYVGDVPAEIDEILDSLRAGGESSITFER